MEEVIGSIPIRSNNNPFITSYLQALSNRLQLWRGAGRGPEIFTLRTSIIQS